MTPAVRNVILGASYCSEARDLFTAMTEKPNSKRKRTIDRFIKALKGAGVWTKIDYMWVLAAHTEQAALLNWKNPGTATASSVSGMAFTANSGFASDEAADYLETGVSINSANATQDNAHIGGKIAGTLADGKNAQFVGRSDANGRMNAAISNVTGTYSASSRSMTSGLSHTTITIAAPEGYYTVSRRGSTDSELYRNGVSIDSSATASESVGSGTLQVGRSNGAFSPATVIHQLIHLGVALSDGEVAAIDEAVDAYFAGL